MKDLIASLFVACAPQECAALLTPRTQVFQNVSPGKNFCSQNLENALKNFGWWFLREGGSHEVWTNGKETMAVPRHNEINEKLAKAIIKGIKKAKD